MQDKVGINTTNKIDLEVAHNTFREVTKMKKDLDAILAFLISTYKEELSNFLFIDNVNIDITPLVYA